MKNRWTTIDFWRTMTHFGRILRKILYKNAQFHGNPIICNSAALWRSGGGAVAWDCWRWVGGDEFVYILLVKFYMTVMLTLPSFWKINHQFHLTNFCSKWIFNSRGERAREPMPKYRFYSVAVGENVWYAKLTTRYSHLVISSSTWAFLKTTSVCGKLYSVSSKLYSLCASVRRCNILR